MIVRQEVRFLFPALSNMEVVLEEFCPYKGHWVDEKDYDQRAGWCIRCKAEATGKYAIVCSSCGRTRIVDTPKRSLCSVCRGGQKYRLICKLCNGPKSSRDQVCKQCAVTHRDRIKYYTMRAKSHTTRYGWSKRKQTLWVMEQVRKAGRALSDVQG